MGRHLERYPEYKDSGLPWLGLIPAHWEIQRNGRLFSQRNENGFPDLPILEVSLKTGVRVRDLDNQKRKQMMADRAKYKRAVRGDIAYNMMRLWQGAVGVAPVDGLVSPAYVVAKPHSGTNSRYYAYLFRTAAYMNEVNKYSHGIVTDRNRLYWDEFKQMPSVFPPPDEQAAIANYLDHHGALVSRYVRNKRRLIELLREQKKAVIQQAVTRGLDSNVRTKPSGIDWLGDIPAHWDILKLKFIATQVVGGSTPPSTSGDCWDGDVVWVTPEDVSKVQVLVDCARRITRTGLKACSAVLVPKGSIIVTSRAPVGNVAVAGAELCTNQGCKAIVPKPEVFDSEYGYHLLCVAQPELQRLAKGTTFTEISTFALANVKFPVPPIAEQRAVARIIESRSRPISEAITCALRQIDSIWEYRARFIADVVTGRLDVRSMAPAVTDVPQSIEDITGEAAAAEDEEVLPEEAAEEVAIGNE